MLLPYSSVLEHFRYVAQLCQSAAVSLPCFYIMDFSTCYLNHHLCLRAQKTGQSHGHTARNIQNADFVKKPTKRWCIQAR
jgi:hypothetical protein